MPDEIIEDEVRLLAAIAYGEASIEDNENEIFGIAYAAANRARAWGGRSIKKMIDDDPNYTYAANGSNERFNLLNRSSVSDIEKSKAMSIAIKKAKEALAGTGTDPSNGAYWWDGVDFKTNYTNHPKVLKGFKYGDASHNIFGVEEKTKAVVLYWKVKDKKTGQEVNSKERGRYDHVFVSTAAHGKTIFWKFNPDYIRATGAKAYK